MRHEEIFFNDGMIRGKQRNRCGGITLVKMHQREKDGGSGTAVLRLNDHVLGRCRGKLAAKLPDPGMFLGEDRDHLLRREQFFGATQGLLQHRSLAHGVEILLRKNAGASAATRIARPGLVLACHDDSPAMDRTLRIVSLEMRHVPPIQLER